MPTSEKDWNFFFMLSSLKINFQSYFPPKDYILEKCKLYLEFIMHVLSMMGLMDFLASFTWQRKYPNSSKVYKIK